jgi:ketosteroid isomerase-like protein
MRSVFLQAVVALVGVGIGVSTAFGQSARPLEVGKPAEQSIAGTDVQAYTFTAAANSTVAVFVMQKGVDVVVSLLAPDGRKLVEVDSPNGTEGPEPLSALVEAAGTYRVEVRRLLEGPNLETGPYQITLETLRPAIDVELRTHAEQKALTTREEEWERALEKHDLAAVSALLADDFFYFHNSPGGADKAQHLASMAERHKRDAEAVESHTITDRTIQIYGDTAVAGGGGVIRMQRKEGTASIPGRFIHVWQRREGVAACGRPFLRRGQ